MKKYYLALILSISTIFLTGCADETRFFLNVMGRDNNHNIEYGNQEKYLKILTFTSDGQKYEFSFIDENGFVHSSTQERFLHKSIKINNKLKNNEINATYSVVIKKKVYKTSEKKSERIEVISENIKVDKDTPICLEMNEFTFMHGVIK